MTYFRKPFRNEYFSIVSKKILFKKDVIQWMFILEANMIKV